MTPRFAMGRVPLVARSYTDVVRRLRIREEACGRGRVVLVAAAARHGAKALGALSEVAMAVAYMSARGCEGVGPPRRMRVGLIVARAGWEGHVRAVARATPLSDRGWLLDCEARDEDERLLSTAFAYVPPA